MNLARQCQAQVGRYAAPNKARLWFRGILRHALHHATGAILAGVSTNGIEGMAPVALQPYVDGLAMSLTQCAAVFVMSLWLAGLRYVHEATAPGGTTPPM